MTWRAGDVAPGTRLVDYAKAHLAVVPVDAIGPLIAAGHVAIGGRVGRIDDPVHAGDTVAVEPDAIAALRLAAEPIAIAVCLEDDDLVVVEKPAGIHVHPIGPYRTGTLVNALLHHAGARDDMPWARWRPHPAHRLDRAASGLVLIAKRAAIHDALRAGFEAHRIERRYRALVHGNVRDDAGTIDAPLGRDPALDYRRAVVAGGAPAITHYRVIRRDTERTLVELELATGRTHQIRAHLAHIGHPIVGDALYARGERDATVIALHATALRFRHPRDARPIACDSRYDEA